jgi:hypothetical protein
MPNCKNCGESGESHPWHVRAPLRGRCKDGQHYFPETTPRLSVYTDKKGKRRLMPTEKPANGCVAKLNYKRKKQL